MQRMIGTHIGAFIQGELPARQQPVLLCLANYVRDTMVIFVAINEFLSVCTHLAALGLRVPEALQARLRSYRDGALDCPSQPSSLTPDTAPPHPAGDGSGGAQ